MKADGNPFAGPHAHRTNLQTISPYDLLIVRLFQRVGSNRLRSMIATPRSSYPLDPISPAKRLEIAWPASFTLANSPRSAIARSIRPAGPETLIAPTTF